MIMTIIIMIMNNIEYICIYIYTMINIGTVKSNRARSFNECKHTREKKNAQVFFNKTHYNKDHPKM